MNYLFLFDHEVDPTMNEINVETSEIRELCVLQKVIKKVESQLSRDHTVGVPI
jgi:hypothetical protein